jgi:C4-type Zn-finger protein
MQLACPNCGTRDVRVSHPQGLVQYIKHVVGISSLRCRRCRYRWETSVWSNRSWRYAKCPRCYRQELSKWTTRHYNPPRWTRLLLCLGARPRRCEACRCNFASFKPRKGSFAWRHQVRAERAPVIADPGESGQHVAVMAEQTPPGEGSGEQMP